MSKNLQEKLQNERDPKPKSDLKSKCKRLKRIITIEPLIACYQMAQYLSKPALHNLEFEKACRVNLAYNDTICDAVLSGKYGRYRMENGMIQILISNLHSWQQPIQSFMPLILALFLGSFSDRYKWRKPFLLFPIAGEILGVIGCILCVMFMDKWPVEYQGLSQKIIPSLFGGQTMLIMASTAYIADVSTVEMRTLRLGVLQLVLSFASPTSQSFSGVAFKNIGYIGILGISMILNIMALCYGLFWVKEANRIKMNNMCVLLDVFNPQHAVATFNLILKKSEKNNRTDIFLLIALIFFYKFAFEGETDVLFLYLQNVFQWSAVDYSYFLTFNAIIHLAGNFMAVAFLAKLLSNDLMMVLISLLDKILTNIIFGLATNAITLYIGVILSIVSRIFRVAKKSLTTKIVCEADIGKAQSLFGIFEAMAPMFAIPVYHKLVYIYTLQTFPAAFLFLSVLWYMICCGLVGVMQIKKTRRNGEYNLKTFSVENGVQEKIHIYHIS